MRCQCFYSAVMANAKLDYYCIIRAERSGKNLGPAGPQVFRLTCSHQQKYLNQWKAWNVSRQWKNLVALIKLWQCLIILASWLVLTSDLLEDKHIDNIMNNLFVSLLYNTSRFDVVVHLFSYSSQLTSKCYKNVSDTLIWRFVCHVFVLTTCWSHLWSITEQTLHNMEIQHSHFLVYQQVLHWYWETWLFLAEGLALSW